MVLYLFESPFHSLLISIMKYGVILWMFIQLAQCKVLPDYIQELVCRKSDPKYEKCILSTIEKTRPYLIKGIPEINFPPIDPFELPFMSVDRTLNDLVSIKAVLKNVKVIGSEKFIIEHLRANPANMTGELRVTLPHTHLSMEYDVKGQLLIIPLQSKGFFSGNFTDTTIFAKGSVKTIDKDGVKYFRVDKFSTKIRVGDGEIKLISKNPDLQFGADLIANFYNQNPRQVMDAVNPIFVETSTDLFRVIMDQMLATVPAKELLPE